MVPGKTCSSKYSSNKLGLSDARVQCWAVGKRSTSALTFIRGIRMERLLFVRLRLSAEGSKGLGTCVSLAVPREGCDGKPDFLRDWDKSSGDCARLLALGTANPSSRGDAWRLLCRINDFLQKSESGCTLKIRRR